MEDLTDSRMLEVVNRRRIKDNAISMTGAVHPDAKLRVYLQRGWQVPLVVDVSWKDPKGLKAHGFTEIQFTRDGLRELMICAIRLANKHFAVDTKYARYFIDWVI
jgi:hypothetical protein